MIAVGRGQLKEFLMLHNIDSVEDGILELCHKLADAEEKNGELQLKLTKICGEHSVNAYNLLKNIREVVRALAPNKHEITNAYASLGLDDSFTIQIFV